MDAADRDCQTEPGAWSRTLKEALQARGLELRETHISLVFLDADRVYKVRKAVDLGFLDFRTLQARRDDCERELLLNRRFSSGVYLELVPITGDDDGRLQLGGAGEPLEWAVAMRRLPDGDSALARLEAGHLERDDVVHLADEIAAFHERCEHGAHIDRFGSRELIEQNVIENFEQTRSQALEVLSAQALAEIERFQRGFLAQHDALLSRRIAQARIRDGHGDLRLEHCYLDADGSVQIIDCIEFNERFRFGDVCADIAFLSMDLRWHGRHDLAETLLASYARQSGDYELYALVNFYESYRAYVRAKVSSMLADDASADEAVRARARRDARKYYLLAEASGRESLEAPVIYAVGGWIASGKSTLSEALSEALNAPIVDADHTRKALSQVAPETPLHDAAFSDHYSDETSDRVYAELRRLAAGIVESGRPVVVDASFRSRRHRAALRELAAELGCRLVFVECKVAAEVCHQRLVERARGTSVSDGRLEIFDDFVARFEPFDELPPEQHCAIDTCTTDLQDNLAAVLAVAGAR